MIEILRAFLDEDQANLIACMLFSIFISFLLKPIRSKYLLLATSIGFSIFFQSLIYSSEKYILWFQQQIIYVLLRIAPREKIGIIVFIESFTFLTIVQIRRMYLTYGENKVDITGILMMQVFLYIGLAYNYQNGKDVQNLSESAKKRAVKHVPDYLTYLGYVFFLPCCLIGPVFEFRDFEDYINKREEYENIPSNVKAVLNESKIFLCCLAIYVGTMKF